MVRTHHGPYYLLGHLLTFRFLDEGHRPEPISAAPSYRHHNQIQDKDNAADLPKDDQRHDDPGKGAPIEEEQNSELSKNSQVDGPVVSDAHDAEPKLEIIDQSEIFAEEVDGLVFCHTQIVLKRGKEHFCAILGERESDLKHLDIASLDLVPIPRERFYPLFKQGLTEAPEPSPDTHVKRPCHVHWFPPNPKPESLVHLVVEEAEICEILNKDPHPNIVRYLGCLVEDNRITGLCFEKCTSTLSDKLADSTPEERIMYYEGIEKGVGHLHQLGLIHNDLNPSNIIMNGDTPVIIDFDCCRPNGKRLGDKRPCGWEAEDVEFATPENDFYDLEKLREYVLNGGKIKND